MSAAHPEAGPEGRADAQGARRADASSDVLGRAGRAHDAAAQAAHTAVDAVALARAAARLAAAGREPWLHAEVARRMSERLSWIKRTPAQVLDDSGPAGANVERLRAAYPAAQLARVGPPAAPRRRSWPWQSRSAVVDAVAADAVPAGRYGLVWSNMRLPFVADPAPCFERWERALAVDGFLMFSTLGPGTLAELRPAYRRHGWGEPTQAWIDMHDLGDALVRAGFADPVMDQETLTLHWPDATAALAELRAWGANASPARHRGLRTPRWRAALCTALERDAQAGRVGFSIEVVYGHAFKAARGPRVAAETAIGLDAMRRMVRRPAG